MVLFAENTLSLLPQAVFLQYRKSHLVSLLVLIRLFYGSQYLLMDSGTVVFRYNESLPFLGQEHADQLCYLPCSRISFLCGFLQLLLHLLAQYSLCLYRCGLELSKQFLIL